MTLFSIKTKESEYLSGEEILEKLKEAEDMAGLNRPYTREEAHKLMDEAIKKEARNKNS